jgi:hypothetical protein
MADANEPTFRKPTPEPACLHPNDEAMRGAMIQTQLIRYEQELENLPDAWNPLLDEDQDDYGSAY